MDSFTRTEQTPMQNPASDSDIPSWLLAGEAPKDTGLLCRLSCGIDFLTYFWREKYLQEYIREGGSKIKFVTGRPGSGKTHLLRLLSTMAAEEDYVCVHFSAREIWLHDFREIYAEIFRQSQILSCLSRCGDQIIRQMGHDPADISPGMTFMDYLSQNGMGDAITRREIRMQLREMFLDNPLLDNNFALACSLLTGSLLGHPLLEEQNRDLLLSWLQADRTVKLALLKGLGLSPCRITRSNARHMLRSLSEVIRLGGKPGLFIAVDNLEILLNRSSLEPIHYTKLKREDTYESIRQLIDDIDSMQNIFFVFAFDRELMDNDNAGLKSYQALWMRIQNEIAGQRFNRFTDIADLDQLAAQEYGPDTIRAMSERLCEVLSDYGLPGVPLDEGQAQELITQARLGSTGIPRLVYQTVSGGEKNV